MNEEAAIGLKAGPLLAGLVGAAMSMRAIADASPLNRFTSILCAAFAAGYITPAIGEQYALTQSMENAMGFFVGLLILNVTAGFLELSGQFARNPIGATQELVGLLFKWRTGDYSTNKKNKETHHE